MRLAEQCLTEWKNKQEQLQTADLEYYTELSRKLKLMLSNPSPGLSIEERLKKSSQKKKQTATSKKENRVAAWWANAGINLKPVIPTYCTDVEDAKRKRGGVSVELSHYLLSHVLLRDVWSFVNDGTHLAFEDLPQKQTFFEFFSFCWPQSLRQSSVRQQFTLC